MYLSPGLPLYLKDVRWFSSAETITSYSCFLEAHIRGWESLWFKRRTLWAQGENVLYLCLAPSLFPSYHDSSYCSSFFFFFFFIALFMARRFYLFIFLLPVSSTKVSVRSGPLFSSRQHPWSLGYLWAYWICLMHICWMDKWMKEGSGRAPPVLGNFMYMRPFNI